MALDQVDKQNSKKIEAVNGRKHVLNCKEKSGFEQWKTFTRIIESFETQIASNFDNKEKPHHEYRMAFQSRISFETRIGFKEMDVNPFEQKNLVKVSNVSAVYDSEA